MGIPFALELCRRAHVAKRLVRAWINVHKGLGYFSDRLLGP